MAQRIAESDRTAHAVAEQFELHAAMTVADPVDEAIKIAPQMRHAIDIGALAARLAVPAMVDCVHCVARRDQSVDNIAVPAGMFGIAMRDDHHVARLAFGQPGLREQFDAAASC